MLHAGGRPRGARVRGGLGHIMQFGSPARRGGRAQPQSPRKSRLELERARNTSYIIAAWNEEPSCVVSVFERAPRYRSIENSISIQLCPPLGVWERFVVSLSCQLSVIRRYLAGIRGRRVITITLFPLQSNKPVTVAALIIIIVFFHSARTLHTITILHYTPHTYTHTHHTQATPKELE